MASESLGASFSIDVTDLKAGLAQANRMIRESESEFKAAAAGMDDWSSSQEGLEAKAKSLNNITEAQRAKVKALQTEYERLVAGGMSPASKEAVELRTKINNETAALNKSEKALAETNQALDDMANAGKKAGKGADDAGKGLEGLKGVAGVAAKAVAAVGAACAAAVGAFFGLAESTRESRTAMGKLETAFAQAGMSAQTAEGTFTELYGVLGDEGRATEAAQQLAQYANTEAELADQTRILTGVFATYGDSIPTEGLAEGIASTIAMSEVQGPLADALEWQGVNLDDFNASLAACADEQEREALITETLNGLYGEAADKYKEVNADVIAAQEAQAKLNQAMNDLGAIAEPVMTTLKTLAADVLTSITPFVALMGEGLQGALEGSAGAAGQIAEGLGGIFTALIEKVTSMLPMVIEIIVALVPQLITAILNMLPQLVSTLATILTQIVAALGTMLPQIISAIIAIVPQLIGALVAAAPQLIIGAIQFLSAIVQAVPALIEQLLAAVPTIVNTIIDTLLTMLPQMIQAAITLLMALVEAIPTIIDALIAALPTIIDCIITGLVTALPQILQGAITLLMAIVDAIPTIVTALAGAMPRIIAQILNGVLNALPQLFQCAKDLFAMLIDAASELVTELPSKMGEIIDAIVGGLEGGISNIFSIGQDIVRGLWNGISDMGSWISEKLAGFGESVLGSIKSFFGIASPSKVMADVVGKNLALGIGAGFEKEIGKVNDKITGSMEAITGGGISPHINSTNVGAAAGKVINVNQVNNYSQAHSRYELWQSRKDIAAAVRLANAT